MRFRNTLACLAVSIAAATAAGAATVDLVPIQDNSLFETSNNTPDGVAPRHAYFRLLFLRRLRLFKFSG